MARRRRRGRFNRIRPDMGWWVDYGSMSFTYGVNGSQTFGTAESIVQFNDITDDDSLITRDNSDWFIKRVIVQAYPRLVNFASSESIDHTLRHWTCMIGTIDNDKLAEWVVNQPHHLFEPDGYEMWARMLRTYNKPVYLPWQPHIFVGTTGSGSLYTQSATPPVGTSVFRHAAPYQGFEHVDDDFPVSNAGLKPEQSLSIACGSLPNEGSAFPWENGDTLYVGWNLRVLLQKRRAA